MIGRTLLHYKVLDKLGEGGMGEVYLAEDSKLERQVALKLLTPDVAAAEHRLERFQREAKSLASLDHPNIVHIYSVELEGDVQFLTMQLVDGKLLSEVIPERGLTTDRFLHIALPLADALRAAHEKGITHRDLKPTNVMLDTEGRVKVLDFGLAKLNQGEDEEPSQLATEPLTREGGVIGTLPYMSPEQVGGEPVDERTDIFSLGVVLYEMATGRQPFQGRSAAAIASAILRDTPPSVSEVREELPGELGRIIGRCLAKDPRQRFQTALDVHNELRVLRDESCAVTQDGSAVSAPMEPRRPASRKLVLGALLLVAFVGALYLWVGRSPDAGSREGFDVGDTVRRSAIAILPFTVRGSPAFEYLGEGLVDLLSTKLDGAGELRTVDPHAVLGYLTERTEVAPTLAQARALSEHFRAGLYVVGEVVEAGGRLHVSASLYRHGESRPISQANVEGAAEELFTLVDGLAAELVTEQVSGPGAQFSRLAAVTTESLEALKLYLQAENQLRSGRFNDSVDTFLETVEIDPEFALAWYRLSVAAEWSIRADLVESSAQRAVELSDRLSAHHQRLLTARVVSRQGRPEESERLFRSILGTHPDDVEAWSQLAEIQSHYSHITGRSLAESREAWERTLELEPDLALAMWHLVRVEAVEGRLEALDELVERLLELTPEAERMHELNAIRAFVGGSVEQQEAVLVAIENLPDNVVTLIAWNLALVLDKPAGIAAVVRELTDTDRAVHARGIGHVALAYLSISAGHWAEAQGHLRDAREVLPHLGLEHTAYLHSWDILPSPPGTLARIRDELLRWDPSQVPTSDDTSFFFSGTNGLHSSFRLYLLGLIEARLGNEDALLRADELEQAAEPGAQTATLRNLAHDVRANWWRERGDQQRALDELRQIDHAGDSYQDAFSSPFLSLAYARFQRGRLESEIGDPEVGLRQLSSLAELSYFDDSLVGLSHYFRGELAEGRGDTESALEHYHLFLELWNEPDAELSAWTDRAREAIARL